jgi:hypothetical protein
MQVASIATVRIPRQNTPGVDGHPTAPATAVNSVRSGLGPTLRRALARDEQLGATRASTRMPATILAHTRR